MDHRTVFRSFFPYFSATIFNICFWNQPFRNIGKYLSSKGKSRVSKLMVVFRSEYWCYQVNSDVFRQDAQGLYPETFFDAWSTGFTLVKSYFIEIFLVSASLNPFHQVRISPRWVNSIFSLLNTRRSTFQILTQRG